MTELIIIEKNKYFHRQGESRKKITAKEANEIFQRWRDEGKEVKRQGRLGGRIIQLWID